MENIKEEIVEEVNKINNAIVPQSEQRTEIRPIDMFGDNYRMATQLAKSSLLPPTYQNKPENCIIALGMSQKIGVDFFTVTQNLNVIKGKTSWSGSFCRTLIELTGKYKDLNLKYTGTKGTDTYGCYLEATRVSDGEIIKGPEVTMKMAKQEGWTSNTKWLNLSELMLAYRCQSFFARIHCPEAMSGVYTSEEMEDLSNTPNKRVIKDVL